MTPLPPGLTAAELSKRLPPFVRGQPCMYEWLLAAQALWAADGSGADAGSEADGGDSQEALCAPTMTCVRIDHMRKPQKYCRALQDWARALALHTVLVKHPPHLRLVLHGPLDATRAFLKRLRTQPVDVDSHGRPCLERLSSVLLETPLAAAAICHEPDTCSGCFRVHDCGAAADFVPALIALGLTSDQARSCAP